MLFILGIILIPVIIYIIKKSNLVTTKRRNKIILNILLILILIAYVIFCLVTNKEPFNFEEKYSLDYMIYSGQYIINIGIIFILTPFIWIIAVHFIKIILRSIRVRKNAIIKTEEVYTYYRGDLDKVPPSIIMFTSTYDLDIKKSISATILKLKLNGYIKEKNNGYIYTKKDKSDLLESEKMVLRLIKSNNFDKNKYKKAIEQETLNNKYVAKNRGGTFLKILKILGAICVPVIIFISLIWLDKYTFKYYHVWPEDDGHAYIDLKKQDDIERLYNKVKDRNDYYHNASSDGEVYYNYSQIRADKFEYGVVRKTFFLTTLVACLIGFIFIFVLISLYIVIDQIINFNKGYRRTIKGKMLLNKAYALKNYLKDFSIIKKRTEKELVLWEYYLIYAVSLGVNVKIEDKLIEKYVKNIF